MNKTWILLFVLTQTCWGQPSPAIPPALHPILDYIQKTNSPSQLKSLVENASPSAWKMIQEKAQTNPGSSFTMADFQKLPPPEQQALLTAFMPMVTQAMAAMTPSQQARALDAGRAVNPGVPLFSLPVTSGSGGAPSKVIERGKTKLY